MEIVRFYQRIMRKMWDRNIKFHISFSKDKESSVLIILLPTSLRKISEILAGKHPKWSLVRNPSSQHAKNFITSSKIDKICYFYSSEVMKSLDLFTKSHTHQWSKSIEKINPVLSLWMLLSNLISSPCFSQIVKANRI